VSRQLLEDDMRRLVAGGGNALMTVHGAGLGVNSRPLKNQETLQARRIT
jgi:hypothetical protein